MATPDFRLGLNLTAQEIDVLRLEGGEQAVREHYAAAERNVFGHNFRRDSKTGKPLEQGVGSAAQPSANSIAAYEKYCRDEPNFSANLARMKAALAAHEAKHGRAT